MLRDLHVRNLAVLAAGAVELGPGLNVLTGETGAGKSLVVDSLLLLAGARAATDLIRSGAEQLTVTGVFQVGDEAAACRSLLGEAGIDVAAGEDIVIRREVSREGRNRVFVNDQPVTLRLLGELAPWLIRIHGQREELAIVESDLQRQWLDRCGGNEAGRLLAEVAETFEAWRRLADRVQDLQGDERRRAERLDLLRFQVEELTAARPRVGEVGELRVEREVLRHAEVIGRALGAAHAALYEDEGAALERLARAQARLAEITAWEPEAAGWQSELVELEVRLSEVARAVAHRFDQVEADPARLDAVEERLALLERLARKHGGDPELLAARLTKLAAELAEIETDTASLDQLIARRDAALATCAAAAETLSAARARWGEGLSARLERELADLALAHARLAIQLAPRRRADSPLVRDGAAIEIGPQGFDQVTFLFAPNPGEELRPLARIASGGELARLYLALQLAAHDEGAVGRPTLVFDEVDAGVGGAEASALGLKLARLARGGQILAVTHLPQVASFADRHVQVRKRIDGERTHTEVLPLDREERIEELARMLAGREVTALSRQHAAELVAGAQEALAAASTAPGAGSGGGESMPSAPGREGKVTVDAGQPRRGGAGPASAVAIAPPAAERSPAAAPAPAAGEPGENPGDRRDRGGRRRGAR